MSFNFEKLLNLGTVFEEAFDHIGNRSVILLSQSLDGCKNCRIDACGKRHFVRVYDFSWFP